MNHRQRKAYSVAAIFGLLFLISQVTSALAQNYTLNSLFSTISGLPQPARVSPSINNFGEVAYLRRVFDPVQNRFENDNIHSRWDFGDCILQSHGCLGPFCGLNQFSDKRQWCVLR